MIVKNWIAKAAADIESGIGDCLQNGEVSAIIIEHCPFKPDVAYMPVPRCETCAHWSAPQSIAMRTYVSYPCDLTTGSDGDGNEPTHAESLARASVGGDEFDAPVLETRAEFGCVQWQAK